MKTLQRPDRMGKVPKLRSVPVFTTGPRILGAGRDPVRLGGYGQPPPNFVGPTTSASEWICYWSLAKIFNDPEDPRIPPFFGGRDWGYQINENGGRVRGGAVVDFLIFLPGQRIGIRLQTVFFHLFAGPKKQAYDVLQIKDLSHDMIIKDLYENDILGDPTGSKAIRAIVDLLGGRKRINPITNQTARKRV